MGFSLSNPPQGDYTTFICPNDGSSRIPRHLCTVLPYKTVNFTVISMWFEHRNSWI